MYVAILPGFGIVSHILPVFTRKPLLGPRVFIACLIAIAFLSYTVWGHHMFLSGMNPFSATLFSVPTLVITIPATIITLLWIGTIYGGRLRFTAASLFALGFVSVFVSGGISGFFLAQPSTDIYLHGTYFVVAHFHFVMGVAAMFGIFAGTYFWFPKLFGRFMNETLGKWHFWLTFIGVYCIFMPMHYLGLAGNIRRYSAFTDDYLKPLIPLHRDRGALYGRCAAHLPLQSLPQPVPGSESAGQSVGGHHARVVHVLTAAGGQFRRPSSRRDARPQRIRRQRWTRPRLRHAGGGLIMAAVMPPPPLTTRPAATATEAPRAQPAQTGMWVAIATISMSFAALTSAMVVRQSGAPDWQHFHLPSILYANTAVLLISSVTLEWARRRSAAALSVTLALGLLFVAGQITAWRELGAQGLFLATAASSSFFYVFTALHGLHVMGGLGAVGYLLQRRLLAGRVAPTTFAATALYWHFMAVLWLYLLVLLAARV